LLQLALLLLYALRCCQGLRLLLVHQKLQIHTRCYLLLQCQLCKLLRNSNGADASGSCSGSNCVVRLQLCLQLSAAGRSRKQFWLRRRGPARA
jgi:hypothetical protein